MKTLKLEFHEDTNGGRMLVEVMNLMSDKTKNNFKIMTILKGLGMDISITDVCKLKDDYTGVDGDRVTVWIDEPKEKALKEIEDNCYHINTESGDAIEVLDKEDVIDIVNKLQASHDSLVRSIVELVEMMELVGDDIPKSFITQARHIVHEAKELNRWN